MSSLSTAQQRALALLPKITGWTSFCFSAVVAVTILRDKHRRSLCYHRLICGISFVDMSSSAWLGLSTWPIPAGSGPLWAAGNDTTCSIQGFFTQFGVSSSFYNTSLSIYFYLVIVKGFREEQLQKIEPFLHAIPLLWATASSITGLVLDVYASANLWCWVSADKEAFRWGAFYGPLWCMILLVTVLCGAIFWHVRRLEAAAHRHRLFQSNSHALRRLTTASHLGSVQVPRSSAVGSIKDEGEEEKTTKTTQQSSQSMRGGFTLLRNIVAAPSSFRSSSASRRSKRVKDVARQCFLYAAAFYINWLALTATRLIQTLYDGRVYYPLVLISAMTVPLQGLPNFVVYVMPKMRRAKRRDPRAGWYKLVVRSLARDASLASSSSMRRRRRPQRSASAIVMNPSGINEEDNDDNDDDDEVEGNSADDAVFAEFCVDDADKRQEPQHEVRGTDVENQSSVVANGDTEQAT